MNNQIPPIIADIIENKRQMLEEEQYQKQQEEQHKIEQWQIDGKNKFDEFIAEALLLVPEWLRPYVNVDDVDYERIGKGWQSVKSIDLYFSVPGLAMIVFDPEKKLFRVPHAHWHEEWDGSVEKPTWNFNGSYNMSDPGEVLVEAQTQMQIYQDFLEKHQVSLKEQIQKREKYEQEEVERELRSVEAGHQRQLKEIAQKSEEQALFDAIKNDPIAIHLLKAFVLLRDERSHFEQRLEEANDSLYSMEDRWSRRAEELRRQADDAQRRADDEKYRLQSDLDEAEAKLKKSKQQAERGW